jgi:hypothetical protein
MDGKKIIALVLVVSVYPVLPSLSGYPHQLKSEGMASYLMNQIVFTMNIYYFVM